MSELGVNYDLMLNENEKLVLAEHTVEVVDGFETEPFIPDLFIFTSLYDESMKNPLNFNKVEFNGLQNAIKNQQLMYKGDTITGYTVVKIPKDTSIFYDNLMGSWIKYELNN